MPTIRFPTDGPLYATLRHRDRLADTPFEVLDANGQPRAPLAGLKTLEDLDRWMAEYGYRIAEQRADYRGRRGHRIHIIAKLARDPAAAKPRPVPIAAPAPAGAPDALMQDARPLATPPSIRVSLLDAYAIGDLIAFSLRPIDGWTLQVAFSQRAAARDFAARQAKGRGVKVTLKTLESDVHVVSVPVLIPHQPHPNACRRWNVAGATEAELVGILALAGMTHI